MLLIKNAKIVNPDKISDQIQDILIEDGLYFRVSCHCEDPAPYGAGVKAISEEIASLRSQ